MSLRQTLHALPRDARDTLFLLVVIAWVIAPQVNVLPAWASLLAAGLMLWRGWLAFKGRPPPALPGGLGPVLTRCRLFQSLLAPSACSYCPNSYQMRSKMKSIALHTAAQP